MKRILSTVCIFAWAATATATAAIPSASATNAIVGEAAGAPYAVKLAVAAALRNRGHLRGVYGFQSAVTRTSPPNVWAEAARAWTESARRDVTHGATHFGNAQDVAKGTFTGLKLTCTVGTGANKTFFFK